jgi:hypothetical protein
VTLPRPSSAPSTLPSSTCTGSPSSSTPSWSQPWYGKDSIIKADWKKIFDDSELDGVIAKLLKLEAVKR